MTEPAALGPEPVAPGPSWAPLPRSFYARPTAQVAPDLLGKLLVRTSAGQRKVARIVEVEAYLGLRDQASHARRGPTPRAAIMFGPPGHLYVYLIYGMHHCMNVVTEDDGIAGAVLIRAAEPVSGFSGAVTVSAGRPNAALTGPGKVCQALDITRRDNGLDLTQPGTFLIGDDGTRAPRPALSARIGVGYAGAWARRKLRFYVRGNRHVSGTPR